MELLGADLTDVRARSLAARALESADRIEEAVRTAEPLVDLYNRRHDDYMKEDLFAIAQGLIVYSRLAGNADVYKKVVQLVLPDLLKADPGDAWVHAFLGQCLLEKYNQAAAGQSFAQALQSNARCVPALLGQALLLSGPGPSRQALELGAEALRINPSSEDAHLLVAQLKLIQPDLAGARAALDQGLKRRPDSVRLLSFRAAVRSLQEDAAYEEDVRKALAAQPRSPRPWWDIARVLLTGERRQFARAQEFFRKALDQGAPRPELLVEYGMNCLRVGDEEKGRKLLEEAATRDPFHVRVQNTVNLFKDFDRSFDLLTPPHYTVRLARSERRWMEAPTLAILDRAWADMKGRYGFAPPEPVLIEVFPRHSDFSVRTVGVPDLGALGACFGRVVTTLSPRARDGGALPPFRWSAVLWHEMAHVFSLELSAYRVPRWFTEGLATYEEELGFRGGRREAELQLLLARRRGLLGGVAGLESGAPMPDPVLSMYLQGGRICSFIHEKHGFPAVVRLLKAYAAKKQTPEAFREVFGQSLEEFDRAFFAWLDAGFAKLRRRLPPLEPTAKLLADATADPKDASKLARLAHALLAGDDVKDAEPWARKAVEEAPDLAEARAALGQVLFRQHDLEAAVENLRRGSDDVQNWDALGRALAERERWAEAAEAWRKAAACWPGWSEDGVYRRLNDALLAAKDSEGALKAFEAMVAADTLDFRNRLKLARLYEERKDGALMGTILDQAEEIEVRDLALQDLQASAHRLRKDFVRATDRTLVALALLEGAGLPDEARQKADRFCAIGEDWLARGRKDKACEYAEEALRFVSGLERARTLFDTAKQ